MMNKSKTWTGRPRKEVNSINSTPNISYKNKHKTNWNLNTGLAKPCDTQGCHMKLQTPPQPDKWSCSAVFQTDSGCPGTSFPKAGGVWRRQQQCWWCHVVWKPSDLVGGSAGWGVVGCCGAFCAAWCCWRCYCCYHHGTGTELKCRNSISTWVVWEHQRGRPLRMQTETGRGWVRMDSVYSGTWW